MVDRDVARLIWMWCLFLSLEDIVCDFYTIRWFFRMKATCAIGLSNDMKSLTFWILLRVFIDSQKIIVKLLAEAFSLIVICLSFPKWCHTLIVYSSLILYDRETERSCSVCFAVIPVRAVIWKNWVVVVWKDTTLLLNLSFSVCKITCIQDSSLIQWLWRTLVR